MSSMRYREVAYLKGKLGIVHLQIELSQVCFYVKYSKNSCYFVRLVIFDLFDCPNTENDHKYIDVLEPPEGEKSSICDLTDV